MINFHCSETTLKKLFLNLKILFSNLEIIHSPYMHNKPFSEYWILKANNKEIRVTCGTGGFYTDVARKMVIKALASDSEF